jgi:hypothetical protein
MAWELFTLPLEHSDSTSIKAASEAVEGRYCYGAHAFWLPIWNHGLGHRRHAG